MITGGLSQGKFNQLYVNSFLHVLKFETLENIIEKESELRNATEKCTRKLFTWKIVDILCVVRSFSEIFILLESLCKINVFAMVAVMMLKWNKSKWGRLLRLARNKGPRKSKTRSNDADDILYESFFFIFDQKLKKSNIQKSKKWKMYVKFNI